jgi:CubicO group peptidase (beta-lactamase class C family)
LLTALLSLGVAFYLATLAPDAVAQSRAPARALESADSAIAPALPDSAAMAAWIDGWMEARLGATHVAGATVSIVANGRTVFAKGYGWADVDARRHVEPDRTLFRIGSISKLFVWTSVMQLVEQGRLDLHEDVNHYLKNLRVPDAYDRPVTLADLMTHSPGFEDRVVGLFADDTAAMRPMEEVLAEQMPARVRPPGDVTSYSNHGTALAMQIVQDVSGEPWIEYIERHILEPLGMTHTTFRQPLPEAMAADMSVGYKSGGTKAQAFELVPLGAVGACSSTATDMARFMTAHLQLGRLGDARILREATAREMQSVLFRNGPTVNPFLHGFADLSRYGLHMIGHGGDTFWFHSQLTLLPEHDVAVFISMNTAASGPGAFVGDFLRHAFGDEGEPTRIRPPADFATRADRFTGRFRSNRFVHTDFAKIAALQTWKVSNSGDTALALHFGEDRLWIETAPLTFRAARSDRVVVFRGDDDGNITHMFVGDTPYASWERVPPLENPVLHGVLGILAIAVFLLAAVALPVQGWFRWRHAFTPANALPFGARAVGWSGAAVYLAFVAGLGLIMTDTNQIALGHVGPLRVLVWLPVFGALLGVIAVLLAVRTWTAKRGSAGARLAYTLLAVLLVTFSWQLWIWNLMGPST